MFNYKSYSRNDVQNGIPGYSHEAWLAPRSAFTILQEPIIGETPAPGDTVKITTAHTFPASQGFIKVYCAPDSIEGNGTIVGPIGSKRLKWAPKILIPGDSAPLLEMMLQFINEDWILLVKDATCPGGQIIQFGCACTPGNVSEGEFTSSNTGDDAGRKGWTVTMSAHCKYFYDATITEKPAA